MMSNYLLWFTVVFILIILPSIRSRQIAVAYHHIRKKHKKKEIIAMNKIVMDYIGKECLVYTINNTSVSGVVESVEDSWVTIRSFDGQSTEAVNIEYVTRIREYPKSKKGKRKAIWY